MNYPICPEWTPEQIRLGSEFYRLRKLGLLYPILHDHSTMLWRFTNPVDPWGSRVPLKWETLEADIQLARKGPTKETDNAETRCSTRPEGSGALSA